MNYSQQKAKHSPEDEQTLDVSQEQYRSLFDAIDEGFVICELLFDEKGEPFDLLVLEANASFERLMRTTTSSVGKRALEIFPQAEPSWFEAYGRVVETGQPLRLENYLGALDAWFELYISRIGKAGSRRFAIVFHDITQRKKNEQELQRTNQLLQAILDSSQEQIQLFKAVRNETGQIVDFVWLFTNKKWNEEWGNKAGKRLLAENPGVVEAGLFDQFVRVTETGVPLLHEPFYAHEQFNGWFLQSLVKVEDGFLTITFDITDRKRAEEALRESEAWHRTLFDSVDEAVCVFERLPLRPDGRRDYRYLAMNPAMLAMFGIPDLSGQSIRDNFPDEVEAWYDDYDHVLETGQPIRFERESLPQGLVLEMFVTRLDDGSGRRLLAVMQDVTQRKRAEEALRENQKQLQTLNQTLEQKVEEKTAEVHQLASDLIKAAQRERERISQVLHDDLQQRIYAIRMQLMLLRDASPKAHETSRPKMSEIETELDEILKITRHLSIDLSPPVLRGEGLSHAVEWLAARMQQQYGLRVELQADQDVVIENDDLHILLFNCVRELLFNAVKHGKARNAWVTLQQTEDTLRIEVRDDGKGFPIQASREQNPEAGLPLSLGLPSVRHQLSLLGGDLQIESTPGSGARVVITVPVS